MKKSNYNIEFAHIYINENFSDEHSQASKIAKEIAEKIKKGGGSCVLAVLIDDYNPSDSILDVKNFLNKLSMFGAKPDYVVNESKLIAYRDTLLSGMSGKIKEQYFRYITNRGKCPCSFLIAIWHLLRLGFLDPNLIIKNLEDKPFISQKIITILPQRYADIENKALEIIKSTKFGSLTENRLEYIFF
jgi:hypothetical protein